MRNFYPHMWFLKSSHVMHLLFSLSFFVDHPHNGTVTKLWCNEIFHYYLLSIKSHLFKSSSKRKFNSYSEEFMYIVRLDTVFGSITDSCLIPISITYHFLLSSSCDWTIWKERWFLKFISNYFLSWIGTVKLIPSNG